MMGQFEHMDYMTLKEASKIWGVTPRWINYYLSLIHISERQASLTLRTR